MAYPLVFLITFVAFVLGCENEKASLFTSQTATETQNHNDHELSLAAAQIDSKNFRFYAISDSHQNYDDLKSLIGFFNSEMGADFIISAGDFTDFGTNDEYDYYLSIIKKAELPLLTVIGNHDAIGSGAEIYQELFGSFNFVLNLPNTKLIFYNNNKLEFYDEGLDSAWLIEELKQSNPTDQVILIHHIDPFSQDYFNPSDLEEQAQLVRHPHLDLIINGHRHVFGTDTDKGAVIHQVARVEGQQYSLIELIDGRLRISNCVRSNCKEAYNAPVD